MKTLYVFKQNKYVKDKKNYFFFRGLGKAEVM